MFKLGRHPMFLMDAASDQALADARKLVADADAAAGGGNGNGTVLIAGKSYTQEDADRIIADRAKHAASAERKKVLDELGLPDTDAVKAKLKAADDAAAAGLSDLEKARKEAADATKRAEEAETARTAALTRATETLVRSAVTAAALAQSIDPAELTTLWQALRSDKARWEKIKPKADSDGEFEGVEDVVKEMLTAHPRWVGTSVVMHDINASTRGAPTEAALKAASDAQARQSRNRF